MAFITSNILSEGGISGSTFFSGGTNLLNLINSNAFTGGTVNGLTTFTNGLSANTITATTSINIGSAKITEDLTNMGNASLSTGLYEFTNNGITITASTATTFNVGAVKGWIVNPQDILDSNPIFVNFSGSSGVTTPFLNTSVATYLLVNSASTLTLINSYPTPAQRRNNIFLGVVGHPSSGTTGIGIGNTPDLIMNEMSQVRAMFSGIKFINDGIVCTANTGMTMTNTAGNILGFGIAFIMSGNSTPSVISVNAATPTTFQYRTQTGQTFVNTTTISASTYDLSGTPTTIPITGTTATNQRIYILANGNIEIQFGQTIYYTLTEAVGAASSERFNVFANNRNLGVLIGILSVRRDCTNLADLDKARFLQVNKFGETVGASDGQTGGYLLASLTSSANADQALTTTPARINFDSDDSTTYGGIIRSGSTFVILSKGLYQFSFQPQILQNVNNNVTTVWMGKNGVNVARSATRASFAGNGDEYILPFTISLELVANDVITFSGVTSAINGSTLDFIAGVGSIPDNPAVILDIKGWKQ